MLLVTYLMESHKYSKSKSNTACNKGKEEKEKDSVSRFIFHMCSLRSN